MGLVICPECKNKVSQYANSCLTCGFPVRDFMEKNNLNVDNKVLMCPKCAFYSGGFENGGGTRLYKMQTL